MAVPIGYNGANPPMDAAWPTVRVFISSTFKDMHAERDHLVRVVFPELAARMATRGVHLRPIDLRWGVLAEEDSLEVCLDVIEECRPFFVGLLGDRYGTVVAPATLGRDRFRALLEALGPGDRARLESLYPLDPFRDRHVRAGEASEEERVALLERAGLEEAGRSITAMEVFRGVLDDPRTRMIRFFYFRDPGATRSIPEPWRADYVESDPVAAARLEDLKARIAAAGPEPRVYDARWDRRSGRLTDLDGFGTRVLEDLWSAIDARHPATPEVRGVRLDPEREASRAFQEERSRLFVGREDLQFALWRFAHDRAAGRGGPPGILCVTGSAGSGKSALLARFAARWREAHPDDPMAVRFVGAGSGSTNIRRLLAGVWRELAGAAELTSAPPEGVEELVRGFPALLAEATAKGPVVVVLDGLDQLERVHDAHSVRWLPEALPPGVAVLVSALEGDVHAALRRRRLPPVEIRVGALSDEEARELVRVHLEDRLRKMTGEQIDALLERPGARNPLYLRVALDELALVGRYETLAGQIAGLPADTGGLFQAVLARVEEDHGADLVEGLLSLVAVGRGGQAEEDLRRILRPPDRPRLPDLVWTRLLRSLGPWIVRRNEMVDFYHRQLREAVEARYLSADGGRKAHVRTADYLGERGVDYDRAVAERAWHLFHADRFEELYEWVEDESFQERKRALTGSNASVAEDVALALDAALETGDAGRIGRLGFLYAELHEGRADPGDLLALHRWSRADALADALLLGEGPRFRALVALAHREAEVGQREGAEELVGEALAVRGARLPVGESEILARLSADLVAAGVAEAARLPGHALPPVQAALAAARAAGGRDPRTAALLLVEVVGGLGEASTVIGRDERLLETVDAVTTAAVGIPDGARRRAVLERFDELAERVRPLAEDAGQSQDPFVVAITGLMGLEGGTGVGFQHAIRARAGAAWCHAGEMDHGRERIAAAVEACRSRAVDPAVFGAIARALRWIDPDEARPLFRRLVAAAGEAGSPRPFVAILEALADGPAGTDLTSWVAPLEGGLRGLGGEAFGHASIALARAWARAGAPTRAGIPRLGVVASLMAWNPLVDAETKLRLARHEYEMDAATGQGKRARRSLRRLARWSARAGGEADRARELARTADLAGRVGEPDGLLAVVEAVAGLRDPGRTADVLLAVLDAARRLEPEAAAPIHAAVGEVALSVPAESSRAKVLARLHEIGAVDPRVEGRGSTGVVPELADPEARRAVAAARAGALARAGERERAREAWLAAAAADHAAARATSVGIARAAALARGGKAAAWGEIRAGLASPDAHFLPRIVGAVGPACRDPARLAALSRDLRRQKRRWGDWPFTGERIEIELRLAEAWARLGRPGRAARTLARLLRREGALTGASFDGALEAVVGLASEPGGRSLFPLLVPHAARTDPGETRRVRALAEAVGAGPPGPWKRRTLRLLHREVLGSSRISPWRGLQALGGIAAGLVRAGRAAEARAFLMETRAPADESADAELLQPAARAVAYAELARASLTIAEAGEDVGPAPRRFAVAAVEAAEAVSSEAFRAEACEAAVAAWTVVQRLGAPEASDLHARARALAGEMSSEANAAFGWRWSGFAALARGHLALGEDEAALRLVDRIEKEEDREELLAEAVPGLAERNGGLAVEAWAAIPGPRGRLLAARGLARRAFAARDGPSPAGSGDPPGPWLGPPLRSTSGPRRAILPLAAAALLLGAIAAGVVWAVRALGDRLLPWGAVAAAGVWVLGAWMAWPEIEELVPGRRRRAVARVLSPLLVPLLVVIRGVERGKSLRVWWVALRNRVGGGRSDRPNREWWTRVDDGTYRRILRAAAREARPFDELLGAWLAAGADEAQAAEAALLLPPMRVPITVPEDVAGALALAREAARERRVTTRLRRSVGRGLSRVGTRTTLALLRPLIQVRAARESRRRERARRMALLGGQLMKRSEPALAESSLREAVELAPEEPAYWNDWGIALSELGRTDEAVAAQRKAMEIGVGWPLEDWWSYNLGYTLFNAKRYAEALEAFERVLEVAGPDSEARAPAEAGVSFCRSNLGSG